MRRHEAEPSSPIDLHKVQRILTSPTQTESSQTDFDSKDSLTGYDWKLWNFVSGHYCWYRVFYLEGTKLDGLFRRPIYCTGHFEHFYPVLYHKTVHRSSQTIKLTNFIKNLFVNRWSIIVIYNDDLTATPPNCCHLTFTKKLRLLAVLLRKMIISVLSNSVFEFLSITLSLSFNQSKNRWPYPRYQNQRRPKGLYQINKIKKENQLKIDSILQEVWGRL